jgi:hypothetical protein
MTAPAEHRPMKHTARRRPFRIEEDALIMRVMLACPGEGWDSIAKTLPGRTTRQCRERWRHYLSPFVRCDPWTEGEDRLLLEKVNEFNFAWSEIATHFHGRSDNDIKNRWYSHLKYETVREGDKYVFATAGAATPYGDRKRRKRIKPCPKQNALRLLERQPFASPDKSPVEKGPRSRPSLTEHPSLTRRKADGPRDYG